MQVVGFFGGKGTRSRPTVAAPLQKHLIPIGDRPLLWHVVNTAMKGGGTRLLASLNGHHPDQTIQTIAAFGLPIPVAYAYSQDDPHKIGPLYDLVRLQDWLTPDEPFVVINGDTYFHTYTPDFASVQAPHIWITDAPPGTDLSQFGQVVHHNGQVSELVEKPAVARSASISTGLAVLPYSALQTATSLCANAPSGTEMHVALLMEELAATGNLTCTKLPPSNFYDCGTPAAIQAASMAAWEIRHS